MFYFHAAGELDLHFDIKDSDMVLEGLSLLLLHIFTE